MKIVNNSPHRTSRSSEKFLGLDRQLDLNVQVQVLHLVRYVAGPCSSPSLMFGMIDRRTLFKSKFMFGMVGCWTLFKSKFNVWYDRPQNLVQVQVYVWYGRLLDLVQVQV